MRWLKVLAFIACGPLYAQGVQFNALNKITGSLNPTDFTAVDQNAAPNNPGTATLAQLQSYMLGSTGVWQGATIGVPFGGTGAQFLSGVIKGNGSLAFTTAASSDVISLWTGGCSSSTFLRGDGLCSAPAGSGTVTTTGSPISGNVAAFSSSSAITAATSTNVVNLWTGSCTAATYLRGDGSCATPSGAGTVTSVGIAVPTWLTVTGSPVQNSGTMTITATSGLAGSQFLATPFGSTGAAALRAIVAGDLPLIPLATGVSGVIALANLPTIPISSKVSGTLPAVNGGTGVSNTYTLAITGNNATFAAPTSGNIGTLEVVPSANGSPCIATNYTANLADDGKMLCNAASSAITFTIPANASVAYPIGTTLLFLNPCSLGVMTISINSDTLYLSPTGATGSRTLAACGAATAFKYGTTTWMIFGNGIS
jgi:hypothetical protein